MWRLIVFISVSFFSASVSAQDMITTVRNVSIDVVILEVTDTEVRYREWMTLGDSVVSMSLNEVHTIRYEKGSKQRFSTLKRPYLALELNEDSMFVQGVLDARQTYKGYKPAGTLTLATGVITFPLLAAGGLIPAVVTSNTPPSKSNLNNTSPELLKNPSYYRGYRTEAHKIKQNKVWLNWGISFGISVTALYLVFL